MGVGAVVVEVDPVASRCSRVSQALEHVGEGGVENLGCLLAVGCTAGRPGWPSGSARRAARPDPARLTVPLSPGSDRIT